MSRCFPYPPPGYTMSREQYETWIESIKLRVEKEYWKAEKRRKKEKKKEKKEKRREKEERKKEGKTKTCKDSVKYDIAKDHIPEKLCLGNKRREAEIDRLENSTLSEEHGQGVDLWVPSSSTDSTDTCNKRMRFSSAVDNTHGQSKGPTCLYYMPPNSSCKPASINDHGFSLSDRDQTCSTPPQCDETGSKSFPKATASPIEIEELQYKNLFKNWDPPRLQDIFPPQVDLDWLFNNKNQRIHAAKGQILGQGSVSCCKSSTLWARAKFLDDACIYALPHVVPY